MPTRRYSANIQDRMVDITEAVGAAVATKAIEVTVDFTALAAVTNSGAHAKTEVLNALRQIREYINRGPWPPA